MPWVALIGVVTEEWTVPLPSPADAGCNGGEARASFFRDRTSMTTWL